MAEQPNKDFNWFVATYQMESVAILLMFGAVAFMLIGKSRNYSIAQSWHQKALPVLREQFAYIGVDDSP
jgi:hypothetical protein